MVLVQEDRNNIKLRIGERQAVELVNAMDTDLRDFRVCQTAIYDITDRVVGVKKKLNTLRSTVDDLMGAPDYEAPVSDPKNTPV